MSVLVCVPGSSFVECVSLVGVWGVGGCDLM